jgi:hypothetical protein
VCFRSLFNTAKVRSVRVLFLWPEPTFATPTTLAGIGSFRDREGGVKTSEKMHESPLERGEDLLRRGDHIWSK